MLINERGASKANRKSCSSRPAVNVPRAPVVPTRRRARGVTYAAAIREDGPKRSVSEWAKDEERLGEAMRPMSSPPYGDSSPPRGVETSDS